MDTTDVAQDDAALVARCLEGTDSAWAELAVRVGRLARSLPYLWQAWSPADIDDVVQETLYVLVADGYRLLRAYEPARARLNTYLAVIVRRCASAHHRKQARLGQLLPERDLPAAGSGADSMSDLWELAVRTLSSLDVLILRYTAMGFEADEIARLLSHSQGRPFTAAGIRQRRSRASRRLQRIRPSP